MELTTITLKQLTTILTSTHAFELTSGESTHDPSLRYVGQLVGGGLTAERVETLVQAALPRGYAGDTLKELPGMIRDAFKKGFDQGAGDGQSPVKASTEAIRLAEGQGMFLFHTPLGEPYAEISRSGAAGRCFPIDSEPMKGGVRRSYYQKYKKPISDLALKEVLGTLAAQALFDGPELPVYVRVGRSDDAIFIDLGNDAGEVVRVTAEGWSVVVNCPVKFHRPKGFQALPTPVPGGRLLDLRELLGLDDANWHQLLLFIIAFIRPAGPYLFLLVQGEQGSGKSFLCQIVKRLLDPSAVDKLRLPKTEHDLMIQASKNALLVYDNTSGMRWDMSDALCSLATGGGFSTRKYYTDNEERSFAVARPAILNGIGEFVDRPDLLERSVRLELPRMAKESRQTEAAMLKRFAEIQPGLLGCLFDIASAAIRRLPSVPAPTDVRMADVAQWITAGEPATGLADGTLLEALITGQDNLMADKAINSSLAIALAKFLDSREKVAGEPSYLGSVGYLFEWLAPLRETGDRSFPATPAHLSTQLSRLAPSLARLGINVEFQARTRKGRSVRLWVDGPVPLVEEGSARPPII